MEKWVQLTDDKLIELAKKDFSLIYAKHKQGGLITWEEFIFLRKTAEKKREIERQKERKEEIRAKGIRLGARVRVSVRGRKKSLEGVVKSIRDDAMVQLEEGRWPILPMYLEVLDDKK